jgi:hypothetical protein
VSHVVLDDHLLRDVLSAEQGPRLESLVSANDVATTNLYYVRLCRSVIAARGGRLTGGWSIERRRVLGQRLLELPESILILPMRQIGYRVAEVADRHRVSSLAAEAVAAAEHLGASLCVWDGDDGPGIREAARATSVTYLTIPL